MWWKQTGRMEWRMERDIITTMANVTGKKEWWKSRHGELSRHARASELAAAATAAAMAGTKSAFHCLFLGENS